MRQRGDTSALHGDPAAGLVWAAVSAVPQGRTLPEPVGPAGLVAFADDDGRVVSAAVLDDGETHLIGDLVVTPDAVFATDTLGGGVYQARPNDSVLTEVAPPGSFRSPQGLVTLAGVLILSDYPRGLMRLDPASGSISDGHRNSYRKQVRLIRTTQQSRCVSNS